jgi:hypothetical protein
MADANQKNSAEIKKMNDDHICEKKRYNEILKVRKQESERALRAYMKSAIHSLQRMRKKMTNMN